jgi:hypothetical protein
LLYSYESRGFKLAKICTLGGKREMPSELWRRNLKKRDCLEDLNADIIIFKPILHKLNARG